MNALLSRKFYVTPSTCNSVFISLPLHSRWVYLKHSNLSVRIRESVSPQRILIHELLFLFYLQWSWPKGGVKHLYRWLQVAPTRHTTYLFTSAQNSEFYCRYFSPFPSGCIYVSHNTVFTRVIHALFSILCLTTDLVYQSHERRKKKKSTAQHVRAPTRSIKCERQWRHVALATDGPTLLANNMAAYPLRISNSVCPLLISNTCLMSVHTIYNHVKSIICYLCFMQHAWSC